MENHGSNAAFAINTSVFSIKKCSLPIEFNAMMIMMTPAQPKVKGCFMKNRISIFVKNNKMGLSGYFWVFLGLTQIS